MFGLRRSRDPVPAPTDSARGRYSAQVAWGWPRYAGAPAPATSGPQAMTMSAGGPVIGSHSVLTSDMGPLPASPIYPVTDMTVMSLPAAWRCMSIIANGIGILDVYAADDRDENTTRVDPTPPVLADPWPMVTAMNWKSTVVTSMVLHGNAYCLMADFDAASGYPRQLPIIDTQAVNVELVDGVPIYWIDGRAYGPLDIMHFRGPMMAGDVVGMGVVETHRRGFGFALDLDNYGSSTFAQGAVPPMILHVNRPELSREQAMDIQERWMAAHGFGQRTPAVLPNSITAETVAFSPEDAEYLQSRIQNAVEVCWMFGIDPRVLAIQGGQGSLTYANLEMAQSELARDSFMPWTTRIEQVLSRVLPRHVDARFDFAAMLRPTLVDRYSAYKTALDGGFLTVDEVRAFEDLPPMPESEKLPVVQPVPIRDVSVDATDEGAAVGGQ